MNGSLEIGQRKSLDLTSDYGSKRGQVLGEYSNDLNLLLDP